MKIYLALFITVCYILLKKCIAEGLNMEDFREILIKNNWFNEQELEELFKDGSILNCINECTSPNKK